MMQHKTWEKESNPASMTLYNHKYYGNEENRECSTGPIFVCSFNNDSFFFSSDVVDHKTINWCLKFNNTKQMMKSCYEVS